MKFQSIQFRISFAMLGILLLAVVISIYLTTSNQKGNLLDAAEKTLAVNTQMLNVTIRNLMLSGEAPIANNTIEDIRNISEFSEFSLYRADGTTAFNDYKTLEFVNSFQNRIMFDQTPRIRNLLIDNDSFRRVLRSNTPLVNLDLENREMEYYFPILNFAECRVCHGDDHFVRGVSHFRISLEGIFDEVRQAGVFLTLFFSTVGAFLFFWLLFMLRRVIIHPVLNIGRIVNTAATGNLDVKVTMERSDELGELGMSINNMIAGLKERNELQIQNRVIETRFLENRKYLDNINEGLLMLNREHLLTEQYSSYLEKMFERENFTGISFSDFLYPEKEKYREQRAELEQFLDILFTNVTADMDMIMSINPLDEITLRISREKEIVLHADFQRIFLGEEVENVMVIFEDRTDLVRTREELEIQKRQRESEVAQIAAILKVGPTVFEGFIQEAWKTFGDLKDHLSDLSARDTVDRLFRDIHSVKGTARYLDYTRIEELSHQVEDILAEIRDYPERLSVSTIDTIEKLLDHLFFQMEGVEALIERFREFSRVEGTPGEEKNPVLMVFEDRVEKMVQHLAQELDKKVNFRIENAFHDIPGLSRFQSSLFHILRNALDHGIEDPLERISLGKDETASLVLRFKARDSETLRCEIEDDGRGIDLDLLEARGIEKGLLKPGKHFPSQIIRILFMPGFSSRETADAVSGRGVGLDAVREDMKSLGGKISLATKKGQGTRFILVIPFDQGDIS